jgi:hypothetical protein
LEVSSQLHAKAALTPGKIALGIYGMRGWVDSDDLERRIKLFNL